MKRLLVIVSPLLALGAIALIAQLLDWHVFRMVADPSIVPTASPTKAPERTYRVDFAGSRRADNLLYPAADQAGARESFFEQPLHHVLTLQNLTTQQVTLKSYKTFIEYEAGAFRSMNVYLVPQAVRFARAVDAVAQFMLGAGLSERFRSSEYQQHLGDEVTDKELWVPLLELAHVELRPMLNCNWEWHQTARAQLERVVCRPYLSIVARRVAPDGGSAGLPN